MTEAVRAVDTGTMQCGLLLESAQLQQRTASETMDRLCAHARDLDAIVRDEIHRTLIDELRELTAEIGESLAALRALRRRLTVRHAAWTFAVAVATAAIPGALVWWRLPSVRQIDALRAQRAALARNIDVLEARGARVAWRRCGPARRLCVRIDRREPAFGQDGDYRVVEGD